MAKGPVRNRFKILLAEREHELGRRITYGEVEEATGVAASTLSAYATNSVTRYDAKTVAALCDYFGVSVGDLLEYPLLEGQEVTLEALA